jgi:uncharacterized protein (DUF1810 family)
MLRADRYEEAAVTYAITRTPTGVSRFTFAQQGKYPQILREIRQGVKRTHWMWYVFPQLRALAKSETARYYGLADRDEALAYLDNPVLRLRLAECSMAVLQHRRLMFSDIDRRKLQACMTLFAQVVKDPSIPNAVLTKFYGGPDQRTLDVLNGTYVPPAPTAMGRVEVGHHWEKQIAAARRSVQEAGQRMPEEYATPWTRTQIESFLKGFNLNAAITRRITEAWIADGERSRDAGWESHADSVYYDEG